MTTCPGADGDRGPLTYAADWSNYQDVTFWDLLDYIGIDAYFPLTDSEIVELADLVSGWNSALSEIDSWHSADYASKEIIFTEVGFESQPACWQNPAYTGKTQVDLGAQNLCYQATFMTAPAHSWLRGMFIWWWDNPTTHDAGGGTNDAGRTPRGKPAETVLRNYYTSYQSTDAAPEQAGRDRRHLHVHAAADHLHGPALFFFAEGDAARIQAGHLG